MVFSVIGGDLRSFSVAEYLADNGNNVNVFGLNIGEKKKNLNYLDNIESVVKIANIIILPLPLTKNLIDLYCPYSPERILLSEIFGNVNKKQIVFGGNIEGKLIEMTECRGIKLFDYLKNKNLVEKNAEITAEAAIALSTNYSEKTIYDTKYTVIGCGRIGKHLCKKLKTLGGEVTACSRSDDSLNNVKKYTDNHFKIEQIEESVKDKDIVFNTVPKPIITSDVLNSMSTKTIIIDLASEPGGVEQYFSDNLPNKVIKALSLPSKYAPKSAGIEIAKTVLRLTDERKQEDEKN